jgi:hypothetical protein
MIDGIKPKHMQIHCHKMIPEKRKPRKRQQTWHDHYCKGQQILRQRSGILRLHRVRKTVLTQLKASFKLQTNLYQESD